MLDEAYFMRVLGELQAFTGLGKELTAVKIVPFGELKGSDGTILKGTMRENTVFLAHSDEEDMRRTLIHEFLDYIATKYAVKPLLDVLNRLLEQREDQIRGSKETLVESIVNAFETPEWKRVWKELKYEGRSIAKIGSVKRLGCGLTIARVTIMDGRFDHLRKSPFKILTLKKLKRGEEFLVNNLNLVEPSDVIGYEDLTLHRLTVPVAKRVELTEADDGLLKHEAQDLTASAVQRCVDLSLRGMDVAWPASISRHSLPEELKKRGLEEGKES